MGVSLRLRRSREVRPPAEPDALALTLALTRQSLPVAREPRVMIRVLRESARGAVLVAVKDEGKEAALLGAACAFFGEFSPLLDAAGEDGEGGE